jgi:hypothetical protein
MFSQADCRIGFIREMMPEILQILADDKEMKKFMRKKMVNSMPLAI